MIPASDLFISTMSKKQLQLYIKLEIYKSDGTFIRELTNKVSRDSIGEISIDSTRDIRRSFSFKLVNKDNEFTWNDDGLIFIDKRVKLYTGLKLSNGTIEYVPQGVFILTSPTTDHTSSGSYTEITGQDKTYLYTGNFGKLINQLTVEAGAKISQVIKILAQDNGETMFNFDDNIVETVPYELTFEANSNVWDAIKSLAELGKSTVYFDTSGFLRLKRIDLDNFQNQSPVWSFTYGDSNERFYAGNVRKLNSSQMYNDFITLGSSSQTGTVRHQLTVTETNPLWANCPYSIERIGRSTYFHNSGNIDPVITTQDEALWRNKYSLMKYLGYIEDISLSIRPHLLLESDDIISISDNVNSVNGRYMITSLSIPLNPQLMPIECTRENHLVDDWNFM